MTKHTLFYTSCSEEWPTPQEFFDRLDEEFGFTLDPCATGTNAKCPSFFTRHQDGLQQDWGSNRVICNAPCGKQMRQWASKWLEASKRGALVVLLAHATTHTRWFHDFVYGRAELDFIRGRLNFGEAQTSAPFPSQVAVFRAR